MAVTNESAATRDSNVVARGQLRAFVERIERLEEEKRALAADIKDVYAEAKGNGYDAKVLRKVIAFRRKDEAERANEQAIFDIYVDALKQPNLFHVERAGEA